MLVLEGTAIKIKSDIFYLLQASKHYISFPTIKGVQGHVIAPM